MFNVDAFLQEKLVPRTAKVAVPALANWFSVDDAIVWEVRGLCGEEMAKAQEAAIKSKNISAIVEAVASTLKDEKVNAIKDLLGTSDKVPVELAKRMEMLVMGSVSADVDLPLAVKLAQHFPVEFMQISSKILELTGLGSAIDVKK